MAAGSTTGGILRITAGGSLTTNGIQIAAYDVLPIARPVAWSLTVERSHITTLAGDTNFVVYASTTAGEVYSGSLIVNSGSSHREPYHGWCMPSPPHGHSATSPCS